MNDSAQTVAVIGRWLIIIYASHIGWECSTAIYYLDFTWLDFLGFASSAILLGWWMANGQDGIIDTLN